MLKVKYIGATEQDVQFGGADDPRPLLKKGAIYKVLKVSVHNSHTYLQLERYPAYHFHDLTFDYMGNV